MQGTSIVGHSGRTYRAYDTGYEWNGSPVLGFALADLLDVIAHGDGADSNGDGLQAPAGVPRDVVDGVAHDVEVVMGDGGHEDPPVLYVPAGRVWDQECCGTCGL